MSSTGSCLPWGSHHNTLYPLEKDFGYFEEMKRLRQKGGSPDGRTRAFLKNWDKKLARHIPEDTPFFRKIARHTRAGMSNAAGRPWKEGWRWVAYTNARGISFLAEEFATFQDEWLNFAFFGRDWDPAKYNEYDVTPSRSLQDCALWHYRKLLTCFDGVYWDDLFLAARYDPVVGDGTWTDEKGRVHPGLGLFALRGLIKRTAVLFYQEGLKLPPERVPLIMMGHMTNANLVPILSFLNCTYDWEWRTGYEDFQDRFTPGLTVAETIGRQVGAWPTILRGGHWGRDDPRFQRLERSRLGVCLVHELWPSDWSHPQDYIDLYARLFQFGYGLSECKVHNYWQEGHPATVTSEAVVGKTLVISKPGTAIVAITDYGAGGRCRVKLDLAKLGLAADVTAVDFETGESVERVSAGESELEIPKHDLRIIQVRRAGRDRRR